MYCRNCGKEIPGQAEICVACGVRPPKGDRFCQNCGAATDLKAEVCVKCGARLGPAVGEKDWLTALLLSIFVGYIAVDRFYLGYVGLGLLKLFIAVITLGIAGWVWWLIDVILIATNSLKDAKGRPLTKR
ncbi:MAG TPA: TM2 domain-containing protein [Dehalococcoidia bacterium]|nr:TM2 domain-containing protein [Dehalococcoidia bacterium]